MKLKDFNINVKKNPDQCTVKRINYSQFFKLKAGSIIY